MKYANKEPTVHLSERLHFFNNKNKNNNPVRMKSTQTVKHILSGNSCIYLKLHVFIFTFSRSLAVARLENRWYSVGLGVSAGFCMRWHLKQAGLSTLVVLFTHYFSCFFLSVLIHFMFEQLWRKGSGRPRDTFEKNGPIFSKKNRELFKDEKLPIWRG